jgi:hypothetical protein
MDKMLNIESDKNKAKTKTRLFELGVETLKENGWTVDRVPRSRKSSVRRISKNGESKLVSIRTTQDTWIAFPRTDDDKSWRTLGEVDAVVAVSVDNKLDPKFAKVHMIDGQEMRKRFDRAYAARRAAGHTLPLGRGVWVSLYDQEANEPNYVGAGAGLSHPPIKCVPLETEELEPVMETAEMNDDEEALLTMPEAKQCSAISLGEAPLTIPEAKRRLAMSLGVDPSNIKIIVES